MEADDCLAQNTYVDDFQKQILEQFQEELF
jgi:hypothetical protein